MIRTIQTLILLSPLTALAQAQFFISEFTQSMVQTGPDLLIPFGDYNGFQFGGNYTSYFDIIVEDGTIARANITGPSYPSAVILPFDEDAYSLERDYATRQALEAAILPGTYTFSGAGSQSGVFSQEITVNPYSPLTPLTVTNFTELQALNYNEPITIEWETFTEGQGQGPNGGFAGIINIEIFGFDEFGSFVAWNSEDITDPDNFGLLPTQTSVTLPPGTLVSGTSYNVNFFFARVNSFEESTAVPEALVATITGYNLEFRVYEQGDRFFWGGYEIDPDGWINSGFWLSYLNVTGAPYIWSPQLAGWMLGVQSTVDNDGGWVYLIKPSGKTWDEFLKVRDTFGPWASSGNLRRVVYLDEANLTDTGGWVYAVNLLQLFQ